MGRSSFTILRAVNKSLMVCCNLPAWRAWKAWKRGTTYLLSPPSYDLPPARALEAVETLERGFATSTCLRELRREGVVELAGGHAAEVFFFGEVREVAGEWCHLCYLLCFNEADRGIDDGTFNSGVKYEKDYG